MPSSLPVEVPIKSVETPFKLKPKQRSELCRLTDQAQDILYATKSIRETTEVDNAQKMTSIEDKVIKSELASLVVQQDESIEEARRQLNNFMDIPADKRNLEQIEELKSTVHPEIVDNLERVVAATSGDAAQADLHEEASQLLNELETTTEVYIAGRDKPVTLAVWSRRVSQEAVKIWKEDISETNPAANESDFSQLEAITQYAYRLKAKQQILNSRDKNRVNESMTVKFKYAEEFSSSQVSPEIEPDNSIQETAESVMKKLEQLRLKAMAFCARDEYISNENLSEDAINTFAQLAIVEHITAKKPEVHEIMIRQALSSYQKFRESLTAGGQDPENIYPDWQTVQNEVENIPDAKEKIEAVVEYLQDKINDPESNGIWDERIGILVTEGKFSEAMVAIYSASLVDPKHRLQVLKTSKALHESRLDKFLYKENNPDLSILNRAIFGSEDNQKRIRKEMAETYGDIFIKIPENKWGIAAQMLGGMMGLAILGNFDKLMNEGMVTADQER